jgi:hypothetical protein
MTQPETEPFTKSLERMNLFQELEARPVPPRDAKPADVASIDLGQRRRRGSPGW